MRKVTIISTALPKGVLIQFFGLPRLIRCGFAHKIDNDIKLLIIKSIMNPRQGISIDVCTIFCLF